MFISPHLPPSSQREKIHIHWIETNNDNTIIITATNKGYRVYDTASYNLVSKVNDVQEFVIGDIEQASVLANSSVVLFRGAKNNLSFPPNQLVIWDDYLKRKIGLIMLKENVVIFKVLKHLLFVTTVNKVLIFNLNSMKFITKIDIVKATRHTIGFSYLNETKEFIVAYIKKGKEKFVQLYRMKSQREKTKFYKRNHVIKTHFLEIKKFDFCINKQLIVISSKNGNTLHFYDLITLTLKQCIFLGNGFFNTLFYLFDPYTKMLLIFFLNSVDKSKELFLYDFDDYISYKCSCSEREEEVGTKGDFLSMNGIFNRIDSESEITNEKATFILDNKANKVFEPRMKEENELIYYSSDGMVNSVKFEIGKTGIIFNNNNVVQTTIDLNRNNSITNE